MTGRRIQFRALGTLELSRPDGQRIDTLLSQPKRVALLAYLAAATPRGLHSRDRLVALFSPEQDQPHARHALRQALSVLRSELGTDAIVTVGDGEVGLDFSAVACDVAAFDDAVAAGRYAEALELYRGGFLEAFYIRDAPEFEQWVDTVRARLKRDFSVCARALVDRHHATGDLAAATIWARRARQLAPDDEVLLRRLIQLLDQTGDRAGALQVYEDFADWLKREYGSEPAPETQALIAEVRERASMTPPAPRETDDREPEPPVPRGPSGPGTGAGAADAGPRVLLRAAALVAGVLIAVVLLIRVGPWPKAGPSCVHIDSFRVEDATTPPWLGDSLGHRVARQLTGFPDFVTGPPGKRCPLRSKVVRNVTGSVRADRTQLIVEARLIGGPPVVVHGNVAQRRVLADSVAEQLLVQILRSPVDSTLPAGVLPHTPTGFQAFLKAEKLFAEGRWAAAGMEYARAQAVDSTCYLCSWRMNELGRWLRANLDPALRPTYLDHVGAFPAHYQRLIRSTLVPLRAGLDTLKAATQVSPYFFLGWFRLGDELFHRGPLVGHARAQAIAAFRETIKLRADFAPAWEHLAWALALEGDSAGAYAALDKLKSLRHHDDVYAHAIDAMVSVGLAWRFRTPAQAMTLTAQYVTAPDLSALDVLPAGPRYVPTFGAPHGAVEFGRYFAEDFAQLFGRPDLIPSALLAQVFGYVALGQEDSARHAARQLADRGLAPAFGLFVAELDAALLVLDADRGVVTRRWPALAKALSQFAETRNATDGVKRRAAWAFMLAARHAGEPTDRYAALLDQEPPPQPLRRLLIADAHARSGHFKEALEASDPLTELAASSLAGPEPEAPFFRAVLHLLRADWYRQLHNPQDARAELLWYQNLDERGWLTREPQMAEGDWAFGTLAQWRLARLLDLAGERRGTACRAYGEVVRLWSGGEPRHAARADTARVRRVALACD